MRPLSVEQAIRAALDAQADRIGATLFDRRHGLDDGVYTDRSRARVRVRDGGPDGTVLGFAEDLDDCGGRLGWYGLPFAWLLRITLGNLFGEDLRLARPARVEAGAVVDWWTVVEREPEVLILQSRSWFCGEAWLGFRVSPTAPTTIEQVGSLRTKGVVGMAYWWLLWPIHQFAFRAMGHHRRSQAHRAARRLRRRRRRRLHRP